MVSSPSSKLRWLCSPVVSSASSTSARLGMGSVMLGLPWYEEVSCSRVEASESAESLRAIETSESQSFMSGVGPGSSLTEEVEDVSVRKIFIWTPPKLTRDLRMSDIRDFFMAGDMAGESLGTSNSGGSSCVASCGVCGRRAGRDRFMAEGGVLAPPPPPILCPVCWLFSFPNGLGLIDMRPPSLGERRAAEHCR